MKVHKVKIPIYHGYLIVVFTDDFNKVVSKYKIEKLMHQDLNGFGAFCTTHPKKDGVTRYFLIFKNKPSHSMIAHECLHATNWIMADRKIESDLINDEPQAYLLGWIVDQVYKITETRKK